MIRLLLATTALAACISAVPLVAQAATTSADQVLTSDAHLASNIIGKNVYNSADDNAKKVGAVDDILLNKSGAVESVIVDVGGFLGIGDKDVAVPYNTVNWVDRNGERWLVIKASADQLKAQQAFDRKAYDVATVNKTDSTAATANTAAVVSSTSTNANSSATAVDKTALTPLDPGKIRSQDLVGTTVYGADDAKVGKIGDVVLTKDSKVDAVIIDVGGFLGMGEKEVALGMDKLKFMQDKSGYKYLYTNFTQEQLKAQPAFDKSTWADKRDSQRLVSK